MTDVMDMFVLCYREVLGKYVRAHSCINVYDMMIYVCASY